MSAKPWLTEAQLQEKFSMLNMPPHQRRIHMDDRRKEAMKLLKKKNMTARELALATKVTSASAQHLLVTMLPLGLITEYYLPGKNGAKTYGIKRIPKPNSLEACPAHVHRMSGDPEDCSKFDAESTLPPEWELQAIFFGRGPAVMPVNEFPLEPVLPQGFQGWTRKTEKEE